MAIFRKCSAGFPITWYSGGRFLPPEVSSKRMFPSKKHCIFSHGNIVKETDSYTIAEKAYLSECSKHHAVSGRFTPGKNKLVDAVLTEEVL